MTTRITHISSMSANIGCASQRRVAGKVPARLGLPNLTGWVGIGQHQAPGTGHGERGRGESLKG